MDFLAEAERVYVGDFSPNVRPVSALKAKMLVVAGWLPEARAWAQQSGLPVNDELHYVREFEHITLARVLLAEADRRTGDGARREVLAFVGRLLDAAETGGRDGHGPSRS